MLKISIDFKDKGKFNNLIRYIESNLIDGEAQEQVRILGHYTAIKMRQTIDSSRKRPDKGTHKLENAITAETLTTTGRVEVGIGNIEKLKQEAPYFEVIDRGGYVPPDNRGYFEGSKPPMQGEGGEAWTHTLGGKGMAGDYFMRPSKAIEGIDYVGKAIKNLDKELKRMIQKLGEKFVEEISKASK